MIKTGHAETLSTATALNLATSGVAIVGMGVGTLRPTFTLDTATTTTIPVTAANISISNVRFIANFAAIVSLFTLTAAKRFILQNCEFKDNTSVLNFVHIVTTGATSNDADGLTIANCNWYGLGATSNTSLINMLGTNRILNVLDCYCTSAAVTAAGLMPIATGKVVTDAQILRNTFNFLGATTTATGILITTDGTTNSGIIGYNLVQSLDATTEILVTASSGFIFSQNYYSGVADKSGYLLPAADA